MQKPGDEHLTEDELDALAFFGATAIPSSAPAGTHAEAAALHISGCPACRLQLDRRIAAQAKLATLRNTTAMRSDSLCPADEEWMQMAAGLTDDRVSQRMLEHAASCDHCGPLLRTMVEDFTDSTSPEEATQIANLTSSSPQWQRQLASRLSQPSIPATKVAGLARNWGWKWPAFACAAAALAFCVWIFLPRPEQRVQRLLADAYTERRNLEPRIPGAEYGALKIYRSDQNSHLESPPSLLDAERQIQSNLLTHPSDPFWLQSRARAELLEGNYSAAIDALQQALAAKPNSPSLLIDMATAYAQRAETTGNSEDFGRAIELLGQVLEASPNNAVALFNRAVISQRALLFTQAIEDWQAYLRIDPTGKWADEARSRMEEVKREKEKRNHSNAVPLLTPLQFARVRLDDSDALATVDEHFEAYSATALSTWILTAYPTIPSGSSEQIASRQAVSKLAKIALDRHSDRWWRDFLEGASSPKFPLALTYLASAISANEKADTPTAHISAARAVQFFHSAKLNEAGILRAREEELYASNIEQDGKNCARSMASLDDLPRTHAYHWLEIETKIQIGNCQWFQENLGEARAAYSAAASEAAESNYKVILLGAQDHWSMAAGASGDYAGGWLVALHGLKEFWQGAFPDVRGYNFYYSLCEMARFRHRPFLELSIWKDAIPLTQSSTDLAQVAVAHSLMANAAMAAHDPTLALHELNRASQLFARSPQIESTRMAHFETEVRLARVEDSMGQNVSALSRLRSIEPELTQLSDNYLKVLFYDCFGEALVSNGEGSAGEAALRSAVRLAELELDSVKDDRSRIAWKLHTSETYRDLVALVFHKGNVQEALELWEKFKAAPLRMRQLVGQTRFDRSTPVSNVPTGVQSHLRNMSKVTVVTYSLLPGELVIWVYDNRGVNARQTTTPAAKLSAMAATFRVLCSNPKSDIALIRKQARDLYDELIAPIDSYLTSDRTLIVELDEGLDGLPMEALLDPHYRYFGERGPILSSFGILFQLREGMDPRLTPHTTALVVAVPAPRISLGSPIPPLPDVIAEGELVASRFLTAQLLTDRTATLHDTLEHIPQSAVFHFAGHASNSIATSGLLLSDAVLTTGSLDNIDLSKLRLAVLSACDTEDSAFGTAAGADTLVAYLVRAQVPRVVASRWNVDSARTREFMEKFYAGLLDSSSVEEAIFQAQTTLRRQSATAHPSYWAAFTVFGSRSN